MPVDAYYEWQRAGNAKQPYAIVRPDGRPIGLSFGLVRELLPEAHFATVYAKPMGRPMVDTFITEVSQDTWIFFPWDTALSFQPPIRDGAA